MNPCIVLIVLYEKNKIEAKVHWLFEVSFLSERKTRLVFLIENISHSSGREISGCIIESRPDF